MSVWLPLLSACNLRVVLGDWQGSKCKCECFAAFSLRTKTLTNLYIHSFFYKNIFYKNIEAEICEILRIF